MQEFFFLFFFKHKHIWSRNVASFSLKYLLRDQSKDKRRTKEEACGGRGRMLHRWGGVAHHRVVVRRRAVALQAGVEGRVVQTEVQRRDHGRELLPVRVAPHRLFTLTRRLHPEKQKYYLSYLNCRKNTFHFTSTFDIRQWYKCKLQVSCVGFSRWFDSIGLTAPDCFYTLIEKEPPPDQHNQTTFSLLKYDLINHPGFFCFAWCSEYELLVLIVFGRLLRVSRAAYRGQRVSPQWGESDAAGLECCTHEYLRSS